MKLQEKVKQTKRDSIVRRAGELDSDIRRLADYIIPDLEEKVASAKTAIETEYDSEWIASTGEIRYQKEKDGNKGGRSLLERFTVAISSTMTRISNLRVARDNLRADYNSAFQMGLDARREDNDEYNAELSVLRDVKLPEYLEKIKDAKATADKQFRDDFISRIKENIENVRRQIDSMNSMLRHFRFGRDRYRFTVQPNKEYKRFYDMFMDPLLMRMNEGDVSIFQDSFTESHKKEIDELFGKARDDQQQNGVDDEVRDKDGNARGIEDDGSHTCHATCHHLIGQQENCPSEGIEHESKGDVKIILELIAKVLCQR